MPKSYCVVSGCTSGYNSDRKRRKREGLKNPSLFSVPEDPNVFKKWSAVIPLRNKVLTFQDKVCGEHFEESDIEREHILGFSTCERKKALLKPNAVPSIFKNSPEIKSPLKRTQDLDCKKVSLENEELLPPDLAESGIERKIKKSTSAGDKGISKINKVISKPVSKIIIYSPNYQSNEFINIKVPVESTEKIVDRGLVVPDIDKSEVERKIDEEFSDVQHLIEKNQVVIKTGSVPPIFRHLLKNQVNDFKKTKTSDCTKILQPERLIREESTLDLIPQQINLKKKSTVYKTDNLPKSNRCFSFSFLKENLDKVIKPSSRWGVTSQDGFIIYVYWNLKFEAEKRIIFNHELGIRVFLLDYELQEVYAVGSLGDVTNLLWCIEDYIICAGYKNGTESCKIYMQKNKHGTLRTYCEACTIEQKKKQPRNSNAERKVQGNAIERSKEKIIVSKKQLYQRITCEKRKNSRLKKKILTLRRKLSNERAFEQIFMSDGPSGDEC